MGEKGTGPRILVFEDDADVADLIVEILTGEGFDASHADHDSAPEALVRERPRLLLMDLCLGARPGGEVLSALRRSGLGDDVPVVLLSGKPDLDAHARELGAVATLDKPFEIDALVETCRSLAV